MASFSPRLIWYGTEPESEVSVLSEVDIFFDPESGFAKTRPGVVGLSVDVLPASFAASVPPSRIQARVYPDGALAPGLTFADLDAIPFVASAEVSVSKPGAARVEIEGLEADTKYQFALIAL